MWDEFLEKKKKERKKTASATKSLFATFQVSSFPQFLSSSHFNDLEGDAKEYGLSPKPSAPDKDYLSCFHEQWDERKNQEIPKNRRGFLEKKYCTFYYPYSKANSQTLSVCEKIRRELQERKRFLITSVLVIVGILATLVPILFNS